MGTAAAPAACDMSVLPREGMGSFCRHERSEPGRRPSRFCKLPEWRWLGVLAWVLAFACIGIVSCAYVYGSSGMDLSAHTYRCLWTGSGDCSCVSTAFFTSSVSSRSKRRCLFIATANAIV